ncbi:MAG: AgmX/PglI C-terminal domain-containing protein [Myxococcales bacterium]|nr:AgmX/PglI C-terminal domain-containing protein [Myxococcales bacterium]
MMSPAGQPPAGGTITLCATCGIVAPLRATSCALCKGAFDTPRCAVPPEADVLWVALRCTYPCRSCAFHSPLDGIELDSGVNCSQCGAFQRFDKEAWRDALIFAHDIADLAGPEREGRFPSPLLWIGDDNPHRLLGVTETFASKDFCQIHMEACAGFPTCKRCRVPLEVRLAADKCATTCPRCQERAEWALPAEARNFHRALNAIISSEQRLDRKCVKIQATQAGLAALLCPQCGGAVRPGVGDTVECPYCHVHAFLPIRARARDGGALAAAPVFWLAFRGPSAMRAVLENPPAHMSTPGTANLLAVLGRKNALRLSSGRAMTPLPGIALAPPRPGLDVRQFALTLGLAALALVGGATLATLTGTTAIRAAMASKTASIETPSTDTPTKRVIGHRIQELVTGATEPAKTPNGKAPVGNVSVGGAIVSGGKIADASAVVARMTGRFRQCYQTGLDVNPQLAGSVTLVATVGPNGEVLSVHGSGSPLGSIDECLNGAVSSAGFAPPEGGSAVVVIPIYFTTQ